MKIDSQKSDSFLVHLYRVSNLSRWSARNSHVWLLDNGDNDVKDEVKRFPQDSKRSLELAQCRNLYNDERNSTEQRKIAKKLLPYFLLSS